MSMAIKRASYTGDPGLFGDIWGGIKGAVGGAVRGFAGIGRQPPIPTRGPGGVFPQMAQNGGGGWGLPKIELPGPYHIDPMFGGARGAGVFRDAPSQNGACPTSAGGYHLNKSDYFLKSGEFVPKESRWVKNRKRNPANARATSRAISRVVGAKRYAKSLSRVSVRKKC